MKTKLFYFLSVLFKALGYLWNTISILALIGSILIDVLKEPSFWHGVKRFLSITLNPFNSFFWSLVFGYFILAIVSMILFKISSYFRLKSINLQYADEVDLNDE